MLTTKLFAPTLREKLVIRGRLFDKLSLGLTSKLALISAPAGYGKTTAVLDWLRQSGAKYTWLSLDHNDNDPSRFLSYLVAALQKVAPELVVAVAGLMGGPQQPGFETLLEILINDLAKSQEQLILVLDDYHLITNKSIHAGVGFLIEYKPPALHLVLTTREDPPLALARMRVRNELTEIRASDLMFRQEETERFMRSTMGLNLTERVVQVLEGRTEGWIAGLQLAAISLQGKDEQGIEAFIQSFGGSHWYVIEVEEAASRLNELSLSPGAEHDPAREEEYLVLARVMLAKGKLKEAKDMLSQMEKSALLGDRQARLINIYIIQAGAEQSLGKPDEAVSLLEKALRIALPGRYLRPFIDAGGEIAKMLRKMRPVSPAFVESILSAFSGSGQETVAAVKANLVDGLSEREREILRLVAQGLSNGEIANKLYITPGTTKWHLNNIFSKLGVNSRTKAVSLAQELKLL